MKQGIFAAMILVSGCSASAPPIAPTAAVADTATVKTLQARIAEVQAFAAREGGKIWPGYERASFGFLLVDGPFDTLYCFPRLPDGFTPGPNDPATGCEAAVRPAGQLPATLLAAMPIFSPPSVIVMGTPASTGRDEADWTRTILHEHFHQWQDGLPEIFPRMAALDLSGGDETGMWMLNFEFPYEAPATVSAMQSAASALERALAARGTPNFGPRLQDYVAARRAFAAAVGERNWRYAELELWKEGIARWTEIELGKRSDDPAVIASSEALEKRSVAWLAKPDIASAGREFVYPFGAAEAMLLEACGPAWRSRYPDVLALGPLFDEALRSCS
jgi:hypothetical protein